MVITPLCFQETDNFWMSNNSYPNSVFFYRGTGCLQFFEEKGARKKDKSKKPTKQIKALNKSPSHANFLFGNGLNG
ncbi:MAG: hypothetical protein DRG63_08265 [Deltaproteobacteria bacterium]|nr:MAG: hypothetical protein DRG63_08265 [Deltaproteobacteria bacterium]